MSLGAFAADFNDLSNPNRISPTLVEPEPLPELPAVRQLLKATPGPISDAQYEELAAIFRPLFSRIAQNSAQRERDRTLPFEQVGLLNTARFGALRLPVERGGYGARLSDVFRLLIELAEADSHLAQLWRAQFAFVENVLKFQDQKLQDQWIERISAGHIVGNAYTERGGNRLGSLNTTVTEHEGRWYVSGEKFYCTGTIFADWTTVAVTHPEIPGRQIAVVSTQHSGVRILDDWDGFGQQLTGTGTTEFTSVPVDCFIPQDDNDPESAIFQLVLLAVQAGIARAALNDLRQAVRQRTRSFSTGTGVPVRHEPQVLQIVGEVSSQVFAVESVVMGSVLEIEAALQDPNLDAAERYAVCELAVNRAHSIIQPLVIEVTSKLFDPLGASATRASCNLDRHWRNARTIATHNPAIYKSRIVGDYEINAVPPARLNATGDISPTSY